MSAPIPTPDSSGVAVDPGVPVTTAVVDAISQHVGDSISAAQIQTVLSAFNTIQAGDPLGMVRRDSVSGAIATRVAQNGVQMWRVNLPDGSSYSHLQPTLTWDAIYSPLSAPGTP